jgi:hypothetical protein
MYNHRRHGGGLRSWGIMRPEEPPAPPPCIELPALARSEWRQSPPTTTCRLASPPVRSRAARRTDDRTWCWRRTRVGRCDALRRGGGGHGARRTALPFGNNLQSTTLHSRRIRSSNPAPPACRLQRPLYPTPTAFTDWQEPEGQPRQCYVGSEDCKNGGSGGGDGGALFGAIFEAAPS